MERQGSNNGNVTRSTGRRNDALNLGTGVLSRGHAMTFRELVRERHFSLLNGGSLVVDLNIGRDARAEAEEVVASVDDSGSNRNSDSNNLNPSAGNNERCICGRKRKTPEGASVNQDGSDNIANLAEECECEIPPVQGNNSSGSMNPHDASSSHGRANQPSQANPGIRIEIIGGSASSQGNPNMANQDESSNRSRRSTRRAPPRRISVSANSSGESPRYQPPTAAAPQGLVNMSAADRVQLGIQELVTRRANLMRAFNSSTSQLEPGGQAFGSRVGLPLYSPSLAAASLSDAQGGTSGQTSHDWINISWLQPDNNFQSGGSSASNVLVQPLSHRPAGISPGNVNQDHNGGHRMQPWSDVNRRDPRLNGEQNIDQPIGNAPPGIALNLERTGPIYQFIAGQYLAAARREELRLHSARVHGVLDLLEGRPGFFGGNQVIDPREENNQELDGMRLDIDRMTYEELLALGERIGNVNTGLSEDVILRCLKRQKYRTPKNKTPKELDSCCICLDEFRNRQGIGKLECSHTFHYDCIKRWLVQKNFCPVCRGTALPPN